MRPLYVERIREQTDFWTATSPNLTQWHWHFSHFTFLVSASAEKVFARQSAFMPRLDNKFHHESWHWSVYQGYIRRITHSAKSLEISRDLTLYHVRHFHMKDIIRHFDLVGSSHDHLILQKMPSDQPNCLDLSSSFDDWFPKCAKKLQEITAHNETV